LAVPGPVNLPLNVQLAIAKGWNDVTRRPDGRWEGIPPGATEPSPISSYDRSWCSMGPMIEHHSVAVAPAWTATHAESKVWEIGSSPTEAAARLLLRLHNEGKVVL